MKQKHQKKDLYLQKEISKLLMNQDQYNLIIEYQKIMNLLDKAPNQLPKFRTKNQTELNDQS